MSIFSEDILKLLNDYKRLLKKHLPADERDKAIANLGIKRKYLRFNNDVILYKKGHQVLKNIEYWNEKFNKIADENFGFQSFYQHMKAYLSHYQIENNTVIHVTQHVSCALVRAIQMVSLSASKWSNNYTSKLDHCIQTVKKLGTQEQQQILTKSLQISAYNKKSNPYMPTPNNSMPIHTSMNCEE